MSAIVNFDVSCTVWADERENFALLLPIKHCHGLNSALLMIKNAYVQLQILLKHNHVYKIKSNYIIVNIPLLT